MPDRDNQRHLPGVLADAREDRRKRRTTRLSQLLCVFLTQRAERVTGLGNRLLAVVSARLPKAWAAAAGRRAMERKLGREAR